MFEIGTFFAQKNWQNHTLPELRRVRLIEYVMFNLTSTYLIHAGLLYP
jgi:hypothetical protein